MKKYVFLFASAALFAACSSDNDDPQVTPDPTPVTPTEVVAEAATLDAAAMNVVSGDNSRVTVFGSRAQLNKWQRLEKVAVLAQAGDAYDYNWSATAIAIEGNTMYVTWHSNKQATDPATQWGGQIDVCALTSGVPSVTTTASSKAMKFNNIIEQDGYLYLSTTDAYVGAAVGKVKADLSGNLDRIGFPGGSLNAIAYTDGTFYGVSGYGLGVTGSFKASAARKAYNYYPEYASAQDVAIVDGTFNTSYNRVSINGTYENVYYGIDNNYGGKDVKVANNKVYILRQGADAAYLNDTKLDFSLVASEKAEESYVPSTGDWSTTGSASANYGKHIMSISNGYAYIGAGKSGLKVVNITTGETTCTINTNTTATCVADGKVYAATGAGLRVYNIAADGQLELEAFQTAEYNADGTPVENATEDGSGIHSCNYVAVNGEYIYLAMGQDGVWVFKYTPSDEAE